MRWPFSRQGSPGLGSGQLSICLSKLLEKPWDDIKTVSNSTAWPSVHTLATEESKVPEMLSQPLNLVDIWEMEAQGGFS